MIQEKQISWLKEFLLGLAITDADKENAIEIVDSFRTFWVVAKAAQNFRDMRSNADLTRLCEALQLLKKPAPIRRPGSGTI